ncbi:MAG: CoA transferase, partial [Pseudomonadota bacterium]
MNMSKPQADQPGPLDGIRVVEYGVFHAGPGATAILGDLGAEVIKIETAEGDPERTWTTIGKLNMSAPNGESIMFEVSNRNKRGICLDIKTEKGQEVFRRLVEGADVFLTNLRQSTKFKLGLDYQAISAINPNVVYASVSGYGPQGPMRDHGGFDPLGSARSGMMFLTGTEKPALLNMGILDQSTAITASHAIITALLARERQGRGQEVHVSLLSTGLWLTYCNQMVYNGISVNPTHSGERSLHSPLRNSFLCRDGRWITGTHHPEHKYWERFCQATGQTQLIGDPRFNTDDARQANCPELVAVFDEVFLTKTRDEWMEIFLEQGLMFCSVQTVEELASDPQALANGYMVPFDHPSLGEFMVTGYPVIFS